MILFTSLSSRFPETAGKTLEEVDDIFIEKRPAWKTRVVTRNIRAAEHGEVDPEKFVQIRHEEVARAASVPAVEPKQG